jgi:hypothetical protein
VDEVEPGEPTFLIHWHEPLDERIDEVDPATYQRVLREI